MSPGRANPKRRSGRARDATFQQVPMTVRVPAGEYRRRRQKLMSMMEPGSVAVLPSSVSQVRNRDSEHAFRQDSDFYYLTGFVEPEAVLFLIPGREHGEAVLFCRERVPEHEQWTGERLGPERAPQSLGVDDAFPITDLDDIAPGLLEGHRRIYYGMGARPEFDRRLIDWLQGIRARARTGAVPPGELAELGVVLHEQRLIKSPAELKVMRAGAAITAAAHIRAMRACQPGLSEARLEAELRYGFMLGGAKQPAYESIVGAGDNACVMHYVKNDGPLRDGDLVLIDAGCEYEHYACDVTRTFPVNGKFSGEQRALYEVVLTAQAKAIAVAQVGNHFNAAHEAAVEALSEGLLNLGILQGDLATLIETEAYRRFTVHKSSHWLGLDVHDVGDYRLDGEWRELIPGMVLTVEPGIYIASSMTDVPVRFRGIGIRIEDDVLITQDKSEVLTSSTPKQIADIEHLMRGA